MFGKDWREFSYDEAGNAIKGYYRLNVNKTAYKAWLTPYLRQLKAAQKKQTSEKVFYKPFEAKNHYKVGPLYDQDDEAAAAYRSPNALTEYELSSDEWGNQKLITGRTTETF